MHAFPLGIGGCSRIRTYDPLIKSQLLYQLSYAPDGQALRKQAYNSGSQVCKEASQADRRNTGWNLTGQLKPPETG